MRTVDRPGSEVMAGMVARMVAEMVAGMVAGMVPRTIAGLRRSVIVAGSEMVVTRTVVPRPVMIPAVVAGTVVVPAVVAGSVVVSSVVAGTVVIAAVVPRAVLVAAVIPRAVVTRTVLIAAAVLAWTTGLFLAVSVIVVILAPAGFDAFGHECCAKNQGCCCSDNFLHGFIAFI